MPRSYGRSPTRRAGGWHMQAIIDNASMAGAGWPSTVLLPADAVALLASLVVYIRQFAFDYPDRNAMQAVLTMLQPFAVVSQRYRHSPTTVAHAAQARNTLSVAITGLFPAETAAHLEDILHHADVRWLATQPANTPEGYLYTVRSLMDRALTSQQPGYLFNASLLNPYSGPAFGGSPLGGSFNPIANGPAGSPTWTQQAADLAPDVLSAIAGVVGASYGPLGAVAAALIANKAGDYLKQRYGSNAPPPEAIKQAVDQAAKEYQQQHQPQQPGQPVHPGGQVPLFPEGSQPQGSTGGQLGSDIGALVGGAYGQGEAGQRLGGTLGGLAQLGINALTNT